MNRWSICILVAALSLAGIGHAEETAQPEKTRPEDDKVEAAIKKATDYLLSQQKDDGSIQDAKNETAMTSLAIMALSATGHLTTDQTKEGKALRKALEFVLRDDRQEENGYFGSRDGSRMYGHGIVSLMLAELLGMGVDEDHDRRIRKRLDKAIQLILWAEDRKQADSGHHGGWRYTPDTMDSDLSVTIWQLLALRSAKNAGLDVPKKAIDAAIGYLKRSYYSQRDTEGKPINMKSACGYQPGGSPSFASGAAGLLALQACGEYEAPEVKGSAEWLKELKLDYNTAMFFYGTYYYAQGMYQYSGEYAEHAKRITESILLPKQQEDGSWQAPGGYEQAAGKVYSTSMAILSLSVQYHYLPIYQR